MNVNLQAIIAAIGTGLVIAVVVSIIYKIVIKRILIIGTASKIAVISGASGFRLRHVGSYGLCIPFLNKISWLSINAIVGEIRVENVISKGGTPVSMDAMVIYGIGSSEPENERQVIGNAIRTSLNKDQMQISKQINEILEGNFRETIVGMTPEQLINDKKQFNDRIMATSKDDLETIGFRLYDVKIKDIWDNKGYLKTLTKKGVQKITAQMEVLEKQCDAEAAEKEAENERIKSVSTSHMKQDIVTKEKEVEILRREKTGKLEEAKKLAQQKEEKVHAQGTAKIEQANIEVQKIVQRMKTSLPAEINKRREEIVASGLAEHTKIIGEANNQVLNMKLETLSKFGKEGLVPFLLTKLQIMAASYKDCLKDVGVEKMTILGSAEGESAYSSAANMGPSAFLKHLKNLNEAFGLDARKFLVSDSRGRKEVRS